MTAMVVGQARKGLLVEVAGAELVLARSRWGSAVDQLEAAGYGDAVTVEVVAIGGDGGEVGLSRVAIERSLRQPRSIEGRLVVAGSVASLEPADGSAPFAVCLVDVADPASFDGRMGTWAVGAPLLGLRCVLAEPAGR